ncbi:helicase-related protein, partial [Chloroflexota bacterium]
GQEKGTGKKRYVQRTFVDRGYLVLRFMPTTDEHEGVELKPFVVEEVNPHQVQALVDAFGLPQVPTVDDLSALEGWKTRLVRFMDEHEGAAGGRRLYDIQALDVARMACKSSVALLYEQGGGKTTTMAHWAVLRGYRTVLIATPASVVPGILEDLGNWGFPAKRLDHATVSDLMARKRQHRLARKRVRTARQRVPKLRRCLADLLGLENGEMVEQSTEWGLPDRATSSLRDLDQIVKEKAAALEARLKAEDERLRWEALLAKKRRHFRNLHAILREGKARDEEALLAEMEETASIITGLTGRLLDTYRLLGDSYKRPGALPEYYVTSYQDLSLGDHLGIFEPWDHDHFDRQGNYEGTVRGLRGAKCTCNASRKSQIPACPQCGTAWRGEGNGGGRVCRACGHVAWTMGRIAQRPVPTVNAKSPIREQIEIRRQRIAALKEQNLAARAGGLVGDNVFLSTYHQWPLSNRAKTLFSCVQLDEGQDAKSKLSLRGAAARSLRANGKAILTGTWMKGYVTDLFWTAGWLLGFGSPLWPFPYRGGSARFLSQFGTYQYVTKEYADTLEVGRRKLIPSVSNLNRLWKLLSPVSIRRLKEDFLVDLPPKHRHIHWLEPTGKHDLLVGHVNGAMKEVFERELRKADPNMGAISAALWWGRYVASCPNEHGALHFAGAWGHMVNVDKLSPTEAKAILDQMRLQGAYLPAPRGLQVAYDFNKVAKALEIIEEIETAGEKVIVFTSLRGLYRTLESAFRDRCIAFVGVDGVGTRKRNDVVRRFEASDATVLLAGTGTLNRGVTVNGANHVLILNLEWSPETTLQAEDRCHRPGQTREVHVHYLLSSQTVDEQMYDLVDQKWAAQRAVQDREAQHKTVEAILAEAALANAQLAVAKAVMQAEFRREGATVEEATAKAEEAVEKMSTQLVFGRVRPQAKARQRRGKPEVKVLYLPTLFGAEEGDAESLLPPTEQPVQLAMFAL